MHSLLHLLHGHCGLCEWAPAGVGLEEAFCKPAWFSAILSSSLPFLTKVSSCWSYCCHCYGKNSIQEKCVWLTRCAGCATCLPGASLDNLSHWRGRLSHQFGCRLINTALQCHTWAPIYVSLQWSTYLKIWQGTDQISHEQNRMLFSTVCCPDSHFITLRNNHRQSIMAMYT